MGRIASEECFCMDMEWFGVDKCGNVAVFCSAGCGNLPEFVCEDEERADKLIEFFEQMQPFTESMIHFELKERFKEVAKAFSDRGMFYFDSDDCTRPGISTLHEYYTKVSSPMQALKVEDLPENVQEMLIQQRQPFKDDWKNLWDITVGGSAIAGDTSQMAIRRELNEELGIDISFEDIRPVLTVNFSGGFDDMYVVEKDVDLSNLTLQYEEVQAAKWAGKDEILKMIDDGVFIPYHKSVIELLFFMRNHRGTHTRKDNG